MHYKDGTVARVGDQVFGPLYNSGPEPRAGVVVSITPGFDHCNAMVAFNVSQPAGWDPPRMARRVEAYHPVEAYVCWKQKTLRHQSEGDEFETFACLDYCRVGDLTFVARGY